MHWLYYIPFMTGHFVKILTYLVTLFITFLPGVSCADTIHSLGLSVKRDAILMTGGFALYTAGRAVTDNVPAPHVGDADRDDVWFAERFVVDHYSQDYSAWSDNTRSLAALLPALAAVSAMIDSDTPLETVAVHAAITAETLLFAGGLTNLAKGIVQRKRPYYFNPDEPIGLRYNPAAAQSFWSGHTVVAFACAVNAAVMFQEYHPDSRWVKPIWIGGLSIATATGALRVAAGQHFPTDIIAAAAVGSFAGWVVPRLHWNQDDDDRSWRAVFTGNGIAVLF